MFLMSEDEYYRLWEVEERIARLLEVEDRIADCNISINVKVY